MIPYDADPRLAAQIAFIVEIDKLKTVLRQSPLADASRRENDAEHSWHIALMAFVLAEYAGPEVDAGRAARMLLIHDIVEIDAGDTFIHDEAGHADKEEREERAAERLFGLLPADQRDAYAALWREYEERQSPDARFADALDRLQPLLLNFETGGGTWKPHAVTRAQVEKLLPRIERGAPRLGAYARQLVAEAVRRGYLAP